MTMPDNNGRAGDAMKAHLGEAGTHFKQAAVAAGDAVKGAARAAGDEMRLGKAHMKSELADGALSDRRPFRQPHHGGGFRLG